MVTYHHRIWGQGNPRIPPCGSIHNATRWSTALNSKVNLPPEINFRASWSRITPESGVNEILVLHLIHRRMERPSILIPHGGVRPFIQKSTCLEQSTLEPHVLQIWSRITPESGVNQILVLHRVDPHSDSKFETENLLTGSTRDFVGGNVFPRAAAACHRPVVFLCVFPVLDARHPRRSVRSFDNQCAHFGLGSALERGSIHTPLNGWGCSLRMLKVPVRGGEVIL